MSVTLAQAMKSSNVPFTAGFFRQLATTDNMLLVMPFKGVTCEAFIYEREVSDGSFGAIAPGGSITESTGVTEKVTITNREYSADLFVPNYAEDLMNDRVSPLERHTLL